MKKTIILFLLFFLAVPVIAREKNPKIEIADTLTDAFLDTVQVKKKLKLNDYSLIGVQYGAALSQVMWNPTQNQKMLLIPVNVGVTYTLYGKMFGYMPYFGIQTGIFYAREGYEFEKNEDTGYTPNVAGAKKAVMDVLEVPILSHMHVDFWHFKIIAQIGMFAGYRMSIHRDPIGPNTMDAAIANSFLKTDNRFDYGIKGGLGFGLVFDPVELHIQAMYKHSFSSLYEPDHDPVYGKYYYRYAYPSNIIISAGLHLQLTRRSGLSKKELKKQAREIVYGIE